MSDNDLAKESRAFQAMAHSCRLMEVLDQDSPEADAIRDMSDRWWQSMSAEERHRLLAHLATKALKSDNAAN